jgi:hypothetical protein
MAKVPLTPLVLHAVIGADQDVSPSTSEIRLVVFRDVAAVVRPSGAYTTRTDSGRHSMSGLAFRDRNGEPAPLGSGELAAHRGVVETLHRQGPVLPAPPGVVARDQATVLRWLEVHYVAFTEALAFVEGRCGARVHVTRSPVAASTGGPLDVPPLDLDGVATELVRSLRRYASASTMLRHPETEVERASAAFLVEIDRWAEFVAAVRQAGRDDEGVRVELTGPWPPWDFVKMQFGG